MNDLSSQQVPPSIVSLLEVAFEGFILAIHYLLLDDSKYPYEYIPIPRYGNPWVNSLRPLHRQSACEFEYLFVSINDHDVILEN